MAEAGESDEVSSQEAIGESRPVTIKGGRGRRMSPIVLPTEGEVPLGLKFRILRVKQGIGIGELPGNYDRSHISHFEIGKAGGSEELLENLAVALGTSVDEVRNASREEVESWLKGIPQASERPQERVQPRQQSSRRRHSVSTQPDIRNTEFSEIVQQRLKTGAPFSATFELGEGGQMGSVYASGRAISRTKWEFDNTGHLSAIEMQRRLAIEPPQTPEELITEWNGVDKETLPTVLTLKLKKGENGRFVTQKKQVSDQITEWLREYNATNISPAIEGVNPESDQ